MEIRNNAEMLIAPQLLLSVWEAGYLSGWDHKEIHCMSLLAFYSYRLNIDFALDLK